MFGVLEFTIRARLGAACLGRSGGDGLRSIDSSRDVEAAEYRPCSESSSGLIRLFWGRIDAECVTEDASWWKAEGFVWPGVVVPQPVVGIIEEEEEGPRPNPNPNGEGACATGRG